MELRIQIDKVTYGIIAGLISQLFPEGMSIEEAASRILIQSVASVSVVGGVAGVVAIGEEVMRNNPLLQEAHEKGMARANAMFPIPSEEGEVA